MVFLQMVVKTAIVTISVRKIYNAMPMDSALVWIMLKGDSVTDAKKTNMTDKEVA